MVNSALSCSKFTFLKFSRSNHRWPKLDAEITASFDTVLLFTNNLKNLYEKFNIAVKT